MNKDIIFKEPKNQKELNDYFYFRWLNLRKPINGRKGTEQDEREEQSHHIMAIDSINKIVGVGRVHRVDEFISQIRYMAVEKNMQRSGIGSIILNKLEIIASTENNSKKIILHARDYAMQFYIRNGYNIIKKSHKIMNKIQHYLMEKDLV